jgi:hypothetical protein
MSNRKSRDYDAEIADIVKIAEQYNVQAPLMVSMQPENPLSTPTIKWVARTDEDDPHANA